LSIGLFITLTITLLARLSPVAIAATSYFALYLGVGAIDAIVDQGSHDNLLIYLIWFFALVQPVRERLKAVAYPGLDPAVRAAHYPRGSFAAAY
jgi:hypothetical protein